MEISLTEGMYHSYETIAAMEINVGITEGVPSAIKKEKMKALCRDYGVDIDQGN